MRAVDYATWVRQLLEFAAGRASRGPWVTALPPLGQDEVVALAQCLDCGLPPPLRGFLTEGASGITLHREEEGEEGFAQADRLTGWRVEAQDYAGCSWLVEPDWPIDRALWQHALPLLQYPDGDGLALWVYAPEFPEPAIIYLRHDAESVLLCRTFDEFVAQWAQLGYAPVYELAECRDPRTGFLSLRSPQAISLRASYTT
jgi:hypothetical protein